MPDFTAQFTCAAASISASSLSTMGAFLPSFLPSVQQTNAVAGQRMYGCFRVDVMF